MIYFYFIHGEGESVIVNLVRQKNKKVFNIKTEVVFSVTLTLLSYSRLFYPKQFALVHLSEERETTIYH